MWWGSKQRYNWDELFKIPEMESFKTEMMPDNPSFDVSEQVLKFICERSECTGSDKDNKWPEADAPDPPMDWTPIYVVVSLGGVVLIAAMACCLHKRN